jgi:uncharacterized protein (TIGR02453 family)
MSYFNQDFIDFFIELASNNNKEWFDLNRKRYEKNIKIPFQELVQSLINSIAKQEKQFENLEAKDCIFRINRDIRFSKDKSPYKMMVSAVIAPNGKKSKAVNGVYFELSPEHIRIYGGIYEIDKEDLYLIRKGISDNLSEFQKLYNEKKFIETFGSILGEKNKKINPEFIKISLLEPLIFNKQWYFYAEFQSNLILDKNLGKIILKCYETARPIEQFFNKFISRQ